MKLKSEPVDMSIDEIRDADTDALAVIINKCDVEVALLHSYIDSLKETVGKLQMTRGRARKVWNERTMDGELAL